ncbi:MAG: hypothetical protein QM621_13490 [Aeromicrobium sp.]|uniref:hypothetical protein n=1 Tax=Aeromicrobium sp. TaxID=1871063 RepID=UPI0039E394BC
MSGAETTDTDAVETQTTDDESGASLWTRKRTLLLSALVVLLVVIVIAVWTIRVISQPDPDPVAVTVSIPIEGVKVPDETKIGVVVSHGSGATEGSQWSGAAEGVVVAQERLRLGGTDVEVIVEDDHGTAAGAEQSVQALIDEGVSGIVYASSGEHMDDSLAAASDADVPVVLPYAPVPDKATGAWTLAPSGEAITTAIDDELQEFERPLHIDAGEDLPAGADVEDRVAFTSGGDTAAFTEQVALLTGTDPLEGGAYAPGATDEDEFEPIDDPADVLVITGHPVEQANVVYALQTRNISTPILLTPSATSPVFAAMLSAQGGTASAKLRTVGIDTGDAVAFDQSPQGRAMSAYLAALRQFSQDDKLTNLADDTAFVQVAGDADIRAHDALLALVRAVSDAGDTDPVEVGGALEELRLVSGDGIAGPELDFSQPSAAGDDVHVLYATAQDLGLRPTEPASTGGQQLSLVWFAEPAQ